MEIHISCFIVIIKPKEFISSKVLSTAQYVSKYTMLGFARIFTGYEIIIRKARKLENQNQ